MAKPVFCLTVEETLQHFNTSLSKGLPNSEISSIQKKYGLNELDKEEPESLFQKIKEQFEDILVRLLLISAIISFVISIFSPEEEHGIPPWVEPCVIFAILILNACVGIWQDYDAEKALDALKDLQSLHALVLRDSKWQEIEAKNLVPGDIVRVHQGDRVPADLRVLKMETSLLKVDQSILTGEVNPINKDESPIIQKEINEIQSKNNMLFSGTLVSNGSAISVVSAIGMKTEIGKIQEEVQKAGEEEEDSPLKKKLQEFGDKLAKIIGVICLVIWLINFNNFFDPAYGNAINGALYYFKVAVALAVAAIPEGLPAVITTCLALGTRRMAKENAIVRKLPSVQTLGCTTVICSDKTGTLTTNEMCVKRMLLLDDQMNNLAIAQFLVEGHSFNPVGAINGFESFIGGGQLPKNVQLFNACMSLCNESKLLVDNTKKDKVSRIGLPTEAALKVLVEKIGKYDKDPTFQKDSNDLETYNNFVSTSFSKLATLEFTRDRKSMSVLCKNNEKSNMMFIKGAPEYLMSKSSKYIVKNGELKTLNENDKKNINKEILKLAQEGLRTLAICVKFDCGKLNTYDGPHHVNHNLLADLDNYDKLETEPILVGFVGMQDPPRPQVKESISKCVKAGIRVIVDIN